MSAMGKVRPDLTSIVIVFLPIPPTIAKPLKKIPQTDAIFENVAQENRASDENPRSLRLSIDSKVKIGNLSRQGR